MRAPTKPSLADVRLFLARHQALIVHCSGTPKGIGPGQSPYPYDLAHVRHGHAQGGVSCSVVKPGDRFQGAGRHSTGTVGLVIEPTESESIVAVAPDDAGSSVVNGVRVVGEEVDICVSDLEHSLSARGDRYNEWVLRNFEVIGLFVAEPASTWQEESIPMPDGMEPQFAFQDVGISVAEIAEYWDPLPVYGFSGRVIVRWSANCWRPVDHSDIYRTNAPPR
jgi:hypothetical protein